MAASLFDAAALTQLFEDANNMGLSIPALPPIVGIAAGNDESASP